MPITWVCEGMESESWHQGSKFLSNSILLSLSVIGTAITETRVKLDTRFAHCSNGLASHDHTGWVMVGTFES